MRSGLFILLSFLTCDCFSFSPFCKKIQCSALKAVWMCGINNADFHLYVCLCECIYVRAYVCFLYLSQCLGLLLLS